MDNSIEDALRASGFDVTQGVPQETQEQKEEIVDMSSFEMNEELSVKEETPEAETTQEVQAEEATVTEEQQETAQPVSEDTSSFTTETQELEMSDEELSNAVTSYLSETLGISLDSLDSLREALTAPREAPIEDEEIRMLLDFKQKTGRSVTEWFAYQSLNPSEMDDLNVVKLQMSNEYPNLSREEVELLMGSKYKTNEDMYSEDEVKLSKLQLKIDADKARKQIDEIRNGYMLPVKEQQGTQTEYESPIDDRWIKAMTQEVEEFEALTFELEPGKEFNFGISDKYRQSLKDKNSKLDEFFDQYVDSNGSWNYELLNAHRAVVDNIDSIVQSIYKQGRSDGQRNVVSKAANVEVSNPNPSAGNSSNPVLDQLRELYSAGDDKLRFRI
jgi:hypothetical protein